MMNVNVFMDITDKLANIEILVFSHNAILINFALNLKIVIKFALKLTVIKLMLSLINLRIYMEYV